MSDLTTSDINKVLGVQEATPVETPAPEPVEEKEEKAEEAKPEVKEEEKVETPEPQKEPEAKKETRLDKHPRFIRLQQKIAELEERDRKREEAAKQAPQAQSETKQQPMPEAFTKLFGSNEEAWVEWKKLGLMTKEEAQAMTKTVVEQMFREQQERAEAEKKASEEAVAFVEENFADLEEETGIPFSEAGTQRNRLLDFVERHQLFDNKGLPNVKLAYSLMDEMGAFKPSTELVETKKTIAAKTSVKTNSNTQENEIMTPSKIRAIDKRGGLKSLLR